MPSINLLKKSSFGRYRETIMILGALKIGFKPTRGYIVYQVYFHTMCTKSDSIFLASGDIAYSGYYGTCIMMRLYDARIIRKLGTNENIK